MYECKRPEVPHGRSGDFDEGFLDEAKMAEAVRRSLRDQEDSEDDDLPAPSTAAAAAAMEKRRDPHAHG
jgi:hypothetical protein